MQSTSPKLDTSRLTTNNEAELRCRKALELKDRGEYDRPLEVMLPLWKGLGKWPNTKGLSDAVAAEVFLTTGILTRWLGNRNELKEADGYARDLLTESIRLNELIGDSRKVAEARTELGFCYWRVGAHDEARIYFNEALKRLTIGGTDRLTLGGNARANAIIGLSFVAWSETRYNEVVKVLTENAPLFEKITSHNLRGTYHNQLGMTYRAIGSGSKKRTVYFDRAIQEYHAADKEFKLAKHVVFRAHVKNNIANVLRDLHNFQDAHRYLEQARRLLKRARERVRMAQVDDSHAQLFIAEGEYEQAERSARSAARSFERAGRQCYLAETLVNQGIALARMREPNRAQFIFQQAIEIAHQAGSLNRAGLAALTMIEEIDTLPNELQSVAFEQAKEWLASSEGAGIKRRLKAARKKIAAQPQTKSQPVDVREILFNKHYDLEDEVLRFERRLISETLAKVGGKVTHAAKILGVTHDYLAYTIKTKHPDLLKERTPVRRRPRKKIKTKTRR
ncbi:MAG TPA: helix-turn-helix domain-containing protein [Pyrinomonadaceae bacterium]|nr:helix-turn-helix domain-containing protein [Pyrinomonadaceae bacterium]